MLYMTASQRRLLFEHLGEPCLMFLLNATGEQLRTYLDESDDSQLNEVQREVMNQLVIVDTAFLSAQDAMFAAENWVRHLTSRNDGASDTVANSVRRALGGNIYESAVTAEGLEQTLIALATDLYPGLLVKEDDSPFHRMGLPITLFNHPLNAIFQHQVKADPILKELFPHDSETSGPTGYTVRSSGSGGSGQLWTLAESLLTSGWRLARLEASVPTIEALVLKTLASLTAVRNAVQGSEASVPVRVGLTGILLPEAIDEVQFDFIRLRKTDDRDIQFVKMTNLEGQLTGTDENGQTTVINYAGDLVMEMDIPYLIRITSDGMSSSIPTFPVELLKGLGLIEQYAQNLRLGLLLAYPELRPTLITTWQVVLDPLNAGVGAGWSDARQSMGLMPRQLSSEQLDAWKFWANRIHTLRKPSINVAIGRILAAIAERRRPDDVLVDAVIVWENLFGATTETTLRVTSSLAWLLGTSESDRREKQKVFKNIYTYRSAVVHGAPNPDAQKLQDYSNQAVAISIDALRAVFQDRPELLDEKSSELRSLRILHAGPPTAED
jgi:hypothetical protein